MSTPLSSPFKVDFKKTKAKNAEGVLVDVDRSILQGATFSWSFTWKTAPDEDSAKTPVNLTGCTARMQIRSKVESPEVLLSLTTENGGIALGGTAGTIELLIDADDTAAITWTSGVYDLEIVFPGGQVRRLMYGSVVVSPEVTRAA